MAIISKQTDHKDIRKINDDICVMINDTLDHEDRHVWILTDWHIIRYDKLFRRCYDRENAADILIHTAKVVSDKDMVIFLGDIVDSEASEQLSAVSYYKKLTSICSVFKHARYKVLVRGNNDIDPDAFYKDLGFDEVVDAILWDKYLICHMPIKNNEEFCIHGHLHIGDPDNKLTAKYWKTYGVKKTSQFINVFNNERYPVDLNSQVLNGYCLFGNPNDVPSDNEKHKKKEYNVERIKATRNYYKELCRNE